MKRRTFLQATTLGMAAPGLLFAQDKYPSKPIFWICPYGTGGNGDNPLAPDRQGDEAAMLKQPIIVDNKPGAGRATSAPKPLRAPSPTATPSAWATSRRWR